MTPVFLHNLILGHYKTDVDMTCKQIDFIDNNEDEPAFEAIFKGEFTIFMKQGSVTSVKLRRVVPECAILSHK